MASGDFNQTNFKFQTHQECNQHHCLIWELQQIRPEDHCEDSGEHHGVLTPPLWDTYHKCRLRKATKIVADPTHPSHKLQQKNSFFPQALSDKLTPTNLHHMPATLITPSPYHVGFHYYTMFINTQSGCTNHLHQYDLSYRYITIHNYSNLCHLLQSLKSIMISPKYPIHHF